MFIQLDGMSYTIHFKHNTDEDGVRYTYCRLHEGDCKGGSHNHIFSDAVAICHPTDQFSKAKGRILSLTRAIKEYNASRELRRLIWAEYFKQAPRKR